MNRLTRRTTRNDFESKNRVYWLEANESSFSNFSKTYPYHSINYVRFDDCNEIINKLGRLEDLMERYNINSLEELEERLKI